MAGAGGGNPDATSISIFVSSPGDVVSERDAVDRVVERANTAFAGSVKVKTIRCELSYYTADRTFQAQIPPPEACDLVVCILWSRLGSELPSDFEKMPDGRPYPSGTVYEVLKALEAKQAKGIPDVLVYRKTQAVSISPIETEAESALKAQLVSLNAFWAERFVRGLSR
jgi:hypothetical protein